MIGQIDDGILAGNFWPTRTLWAVTADPVKFDIPKLAALFVAQGFEGNGHLGNPITFVLFGPSKPLVVPGLIQIHGAIGTIGQQALALYAKGIDPKLERVGFILKRIEGKSNRVVGFAPKITAKRRGNVSPHHIGEPIFGNGQVIDKIVVVQQTHFGWVPGSGSIHREVLPKVGCNGCIGPSLIQHAVNFDGNGAFVYPNGIVLLLRHGGQSQTKGDDD